MLPAPCRRASGSGGSTAIRKICTFRGKSCIFPMGSNWGESPGLARYRNWTVALTSLGLVFDPDVVGPVSVRVMRERLSNA